MAIEIERKFRVVGDGWRDDVRRARRFRQAYLAIGERVSVRVRIVDAGSAMLTVKTTAAGIAREEYDYAIPLADGLALIEQRQGSLIDKVRHDVAAGDLVWEIDVFEGDNAGLVIAEIELDSTSRQIELPRWIGEEVTHDRRYYNAELSMRPYARW